MREPILIIVTGMPCTGKTTLSIYLGRALGLPVMSKDGIKETLFESLGVHDRQWSQKLGAASFELLYYFIGAQLAAGKSLIAEGNFHGNTAGPRLQELLNSHDYTIIQVLCRTNPVVLLERYRIRANAAGRHRGHLDQQNYDDFQSLVMKGGWPVIPMESELITIDTTSFDVGDYESLAEQIRALVRA